MDIDATQIINSIIGTAILLLIVYIWGRIKNVIPETWIAGFIDIIKILFGIIVILGLVGSCEWWISTVGKSAPNVKIVQCEGRCDEESVQRTVRQCHLEAMRFAELRGKSNVNRRSNDAYRDFKQCLSISNIKTADCKQGESQCISFTFKFPDERVGTVPPPPQ